MKTQHINIKTQCFSHKTLKLKLLSKSQKNKYTSILLFLLFFTHNQLLVYGQNNTLPVFRPGYRSVNSVAFSPDGRFIAYASGKFIKVVNVVDGEVYRAFSGHEGDVLSIDFHPAGTYLLSGSSDFTIRLWDLSDNGDVKVFKEHSSKVNTVTFNGTGSHFLSGSTDKTLKLWSISRRRSIHTYKRHKGAVNSVAFHPDGRYLVSGSDDRTIMVWEVSNGRYVRTLRGHSHAVNSLAFSFDGSFLVSGSFDRSVRLWRIRSTKPLRSFNGHEFGVNAVCFSPDGRYIISGSDDNTIKLWETVTGLSVSTFHHHTRSILSLDYSPDGKFIVSGSADRICKIWDANHRINPSVIATNYTDPNAKEIEMPKVWAVIVGVARYNHVQTLSFSDDDAYQMYALLKSPEGGALPDEQITVLIDESANKNRITDEMEKIFNNAAPDDMILLYFSGHGINGAFLPYDYDGSSNMLMHSEVEDIFSHSKAKHKLLIADACHSGSLNQNARNTIHNTIRNYYKALKASQGGIALMLSSKSDETSIEYKGLRQGVFSYYLIQGMKGKANFNSDRIITINELFGYVKKKVELYTGKYQSPIMEGVYDKNMPIAAIR